MEAEAVQLQRPLQPAHAMDCVSILGVVLRRHGHLRVMGVVLYLDVTAKIQHVVGHQMVRPLKHIVLLV